MSECGRLYVSTCNRRRPRSDSHAIHSDASILTDLTALAEETETLRGIVVSFCSVASHRFVFPFVSRSLPFNRQDAFRRVAQAWYRNQCRNAGEPAPPPVEA